MNVSPTTTLIIGWSVICNVWLGLWIAQSIAKRRQLLVQARRYPGNKPPTVTVFVPARNESQMIESCLSSIGKQNYPTWSAIVIDDQSEDDTALKVSRIAEQEPRIELMQVADRPAGWMGKSYALWQGTRGCESDWLLFIDADCELEPSAVSSAIDEAERRDADLLTLWPRHRGGGFWEHLLIPLLGGVIALWFGTANRSDLRRGPGFANGQFILIRRDKYEQIGGHEAVRRCLIEDVPLAALAKRRGLRCWAGGGASLFSVRMYDSLSGICKGWSRILFGALRSRIKVVLSILWVAAGSLLPFVMLPLLIIRTLPIEHASTIDLIFLAICINHLVLIALVSWRFWGWGGCDRRYLLLYPLSAVMVLGILLYTLASMCFYRKVIWRGTSYALSPKAVIVG
jgi:chlorobactene glucosyltransferase